MQPPKPNPCAARRLAHALALALLLPGAANALAAPSAKDPYLAKQYSINAVAVIPTPPDAGTQEERVDRESAYIIYAERTPRQVELGKSEAQLTIFHFNHVLDNALVPGKCPKFEALVEQIFRETDQITLAAQRYWQRPFPAQVDSARFNDVTCGDTKTPGSYPSARATHASLYALILGELFPAKRDALLAQGRSIGWRHVQCGGATPLDFTAGRVLGRAIVQVLIHNPRFLADFEEARAEFTPPAKPPPPAPAQ